MQLAPVAASITYIIIRVEAVQWCKLIWLLPPARCFILQLEDFRETAQVDLMVAAVPVPIIRDIVAAAAAGKQILEPPVM